ncbi:MAG: cobaltochelatase subunit CobN, partial [Alistipes sp.]|nr:cobaltochelatase subunit CobN [Alistipes sp.]
MNYLSKKSIIAGCALSLLCAAGFWAWHALCGATRIAFVNYQAVALGQIARAADNPRIVIEELSPERFDRAGRFDMIFVNGMGLRITEAQREQLAQAAARKVRVLTTAATNPANDIRSLDSLAAAAIKAYLSAGGRSNYRNMLHYVRKYVDGKRFFVSEPEPPVERLYGMLYHADPQQPDAEELEFGSVAAYHAFLERSGLAGDAMPGILVTGAMGEPADLVRRLEQSGNRVYPVRNLVQFI